MPYSVRSEDGYTLNGIPDNLEPNDPQVLAELDKLRAKNAAPQKVAKPRPSRASSRIAEESSGIIGNILKGFGSGATGMLESAALGAATLLEEEAELEARSKIREAFDIDMLKGADQDSIAYKLASGIGSIAALAPAALAGPAALPVAGVVAAGAGAGEASERARAYGATEDERNIAALKGTAIGLTELAPFGRLAKGLSRGANKAFDMPKIDAGVDKVLDLLGPKAVTSINSRIRNVAGTGLVEGAQEGAAAILQNLTEQGYNPEQVLVDTGVLEEAAIGGGAGAILQALADVIGGRRGVRQGTGIEGDSAETAGVEEATLPVTEETDADVIAKSNAEEAEAAIQETEAKVVTEADLEEVTSEEPRLGATETETETEAATVSFNILEEKSANTDVDVTQEVTQRTSQGVSQEDAIAEVNTLVDAKIAEQADAGVLDETRSRDSVPVVKEAPPETEVITTESETVVDGGVDNTEQGATDTAKGESGKPSTLAQAMSTLNGKPVTYQAGSRDSEAEVARKRGKKELTAFEKAEELKVSQEFNRSQSGKAPIMNRAKNVGINYDAEKQNLRKNQKVSAKEADKLVTAKVEAKEKEIVAKQNTINEVLGVSAIEAVPQDSPNYSTDVETITPKLVKELGLTGRNKVFGDKLISAYQETGSPEITRGDLAAVLRQADENTQVVFENAKDTILAREVKKPESQQLDEVAVEKEARKSINGMLSLDNKGKAYVNKHVGQRAKPKEKAPDTTPKTDDVRDKAILKKAGKTIGSEKGDAAGKPLTPQQITERSQEVIDTEGLEQFVEPNLRVAPKDETSDQKVERLRLLAKEDQAFVDQIEDRLAGATAIDLDITLLPKSYINELDGVVTGDIQKLVRKGDLRGALMALSGASTDSRVKKIARVLATAVGAAKVKTADGPDSFVSKDGTLYIAEGPVYIHTLLHEATHSAVNKILDNKGSPATRKLEQLFKEVKPQLDSAYGAKNLKEFVSEAMSNSAFQQKLAGMNPDGSPIGALERFFRIITNFVRVLLGADTKTTGSALDATDQAIISLLATSPDTRGAGSTYANATRDGVKKIIKDLGLIQKGFPAPTPKFKKQFGEDGATWLDSVESLVTKFEALQLLDTQALGDVAEARGFGNLGNLLHKSIQRLRGGMDESDVYVRERVQTVARWAQKNPEKNKTLGQLIYSREYGATIYQVDPTLKEDAAKKKYGSGSDNFMTWKEQRNDWNALGKDGQDTYVYLRDTYRQQYQSMKAIITGRMEEVVGKEEADKLTTSVFDKLFDKNTLDVYFPLVRNGKFKLSYVPKKTGQVTPDRDNYVVEMFENAADRNKAKNEAIALGATGVETVDGNISASDFRKNAPDGGFVNEVLTILQKNGVNSTVQDDVMNLFIDSLPETALAKSLKGRTGIAGYDSDPVAAMRSKAFDIGRQVQRIKYAGNIRAITSEIDKVARKLEVNNPNSGTTSSIAKDMLARADFAVNGAGNKFVEGIVKNINQVAFIYTIGFNASSAIVNLSQLPLVVGPMLGAEFGHIKAGRAMKEATALVKSSGNTLQSYFDMTLNKATGEYEYTLKKGLDPKIEAEFKDLEVLVTMASGRSYLTQSYLADASGLDEGTQTFEFIKKKFGVEASGRVNQGNVGAKILNSVSSLSAIMFNAGEKFNRQVTLLSAYKLSLENVQTREGKKKKEDQLSTTDMQKEASEDALYKSMEYNGGAVLETGSRVSQQGFGRVAFMYKNYGFRMYTTMFKTGKQALELSFAPKKGETAAQKEERIRQRKIAWGKLRAIHLSSLLIAGIQGMPIYGAVALFIDLTMLEDDEDDADTVIRKYFGEGWFKGPAVDALGVDFSKRVRLNSLLFEANRYSRDSSLEESILYHIGGPALSTGKRMERAINDFSEGNIQRGIESALPAGLTNLYRNSPLGRFQQDGAMETRRGDVIYDDLNAGDFFAGMVGFPPTGYTFAQEQSNVEQRINRSVTKERSKLLKEYYVARRQGDYPESREIKKKMREFGKKHPSARITYDSLKRSYKGHLRTTAKMHNGTTLSPMMKSVLEAERREYDTSSLFD